VLGTEEIMHLAGVQVKKYMTIMDSMTNKELDSSSTKVRGRGLVISRAVLLMSVCRRADWQAVQL
jgi:hypothetical protein